MEKVRMYFWRFVRGFGGGLFVAMFIYVAASPQSPYDPNPLRTQIIIFTFLGVLFGTINMATNFISRKKESTK